MSAGRVIGRDSLGAIGGRFEMTVCSEGAKAAELPPGGETDCCETTLTSTDDSFEVNSSAKAHILILWRSETRGLPWTNVPRKKNENKPSD
jgi:hypothetical protein